jgi:predicted dehydrogenase
MSDTEGGRQINVAVIGCGGIARSVHLPSLADIDGVRVAAVCDIVEPRAAEMAAKHDVPRVYTHYKEMLAAEQGTVDAVFALVEPGNLFHVVWHCLDAGYDAFMEKPPGVNLYQAASLARKADEAGRILQVGFNRRHIRLVREVKKLVEEHAAINLVEGCFYKFGSGSFDRGSLPAFESDVIHAVDLVRWIAGGVPQRVASVAASNDEPVENLWAAVCAFDNGVTGVIKGNYRTGGRVHKFEIHGAGVSAYVSLGFGSAGCEATILSHEGKVQYSLAARGTADETIVQLDGKQLAGSDEFYRYYGFYDEDRHFIDCVRTRAEPETSIADAVESMRFAEMIAAAAI